MRTTPEAIWQEYQKAVGYNTQIGLYDTVRRNENFFLGKQWEGLKAPDLEPVTCNIFKRVVTYFISQIVSDDIGVNLKPLEESDEGELYCRILSRETEDVFERTKLKAKLRYLLRDCAVDGDGCLYFRFDPDARTGQVAMGAIEAELVDAQKLLYANPYILEVQDQPYLIIVKREQVESVRERARETGCAEWQQIVPDSGYEYEEESGSELVTVLIKLWREGGTVRFCECTQDVTIRRPTDTGLRRYPVARMVWERVKDCYHGQAAVTEYIPNQVAINKLLSMAYYSAKTNAFPKVVYNRTLLPGGWDNRVGAAIGVMGDPNTATLSTNIRGGDFSAQVPQLIETILSHTREYIGVSDAALGNIEPDNTSAIVATQQATAAPLELQKMAFYQLVEDCVRILMDMMQARYGVRYVSAPTTAEEQAQGAQEAVRIPVDFGTVPLDELRLQVDIGSASYWSELMQIQTADNLYNKKIITDPEVYLESIPDKYIAGKAKIIENLKEQKEQAQAMGGGMLGQMPQMQTAAIGG